MSDSADDETPMLGMDLPETVPQASSGPYRVLARKYRPQTFAELIGQDAMVRTLGNVIARDRLAHAFLMTGVRGVGKTSTARLIAKRSEEHTSELQSLRRISYAVFGLKKKITRKNNTSLPQYHI